MVSCWLKVYFHLIQNDDSKRWYIILCYKITEITRQASVVLRWIMNFLIQESCLSIKNVSACSYIVARVLRIVLGCCWFCSSNCPNSIKWLLTFGAEVCFADHLKLSCKISGHQKTPDGNTMKSSQRTCFNISFWADYIRWEGVKVSHA